MPTRSQSFTSSPMRARSTASAQAATAQAVLERPRVEALFPQLEQEKSATPSPAPPRALSRASASEPQMMSSSFGRAGSQLSAATTGFIPPSNIGSTVGSWMRSDLGTGTQQDALATALAGAASPAASPQKPGKAQNLFQASLPYHTDQESSIISDWRPHYQKQYGKGVPFERGLRFQDPRYSTENTPGVCVLKSDDDVPKVAGLLPGGVFGPTAEKQFIIDAVTKQLQDLGVELTEPHCGRLFQPQKLVEAVTKKERPRAVRRTPEEERSRTGSETSSSCQTGPDFRIQNVASTVARQRYQKWVIDQPKKGHRFRESEVPGGAQAARQ